MSMIELPALKKPVGGIMDHLVMHGLDSAQTSGPKRRRKSNRLGNVIDGDFAAVQSINDRMDKGLGLGWATGVAAGRRADRIVAKKKGFRLADDEGDHEYR